MKSKSEVRDLLVTMAALVSAIRTFAESDFADAVDDVLDAIEAGDTMPEDGEQFDAVRDVQQVMATLYESSLAAAQTIAPTLGRYAAVRDASDTNLSLSGFSDKLFADGESVRSRGYTKFASMTADGANVGTGAVTVLNVDASGTPMDISTVESVTLECVRDAQTGTATPGGERFRYYGEQPADPLEPWDEGGSDTGLTYSQPTGEGSGEFGLFDSRREVGGASEIPVSSGVNSIAPNAQAQSGVVGAGVGSALAGWQRDGTGGTGEITASTGGASPGVNAQFNANGNFRCFVVPPRASMSSGVPYMAAIAVNRPSTVTGGTLTLRLRDDATVYAQVSATLTSATASTWTIVSGTPVWLPANVGANLRIEVEISDYAGSGLVAFDELRVHPGTMIDGGRFLWIQGGVTPFRRRDKFTASTTLSQAGAVQLLMNHAFGRAGARGWLAHDVLPVFWGDTVVAAPAILSITPNSGTDAGGTTVTIAGAGFTGVQRVTFDGVDGTNLTVNSVLELQVNTPAGTAGDVDVSVYAAGGIVTDVDGFTYT